MRRHPIHKTQTIALLASMLLVACGDKDDTGAVDSGSTGATLPQEGDWIPSNLAVVSDGCGLYPDGLGDEDNTTAATLSLNDDNTAFTLIDDTGLLLTCALDTSGSFACDPLEDNTDFTEDGFDVYLVRAITYSGVFETPTSGSLSLELSISCDGDDCGMFEKKKGTTLPCTVLIEGDVNLVE